MFAACYVSEISPGRTPPYLLLSGTVARSSPTWVIASRIGNWQGHECCFLLSFARQATSLRVDEHARQMTTESIKRLGLSSLSCRMNQHTQAGRCGRQQVILMMNISIQLTTNLEGQGICSTLIASS